MSQRRAPQLAQYNMILRRERARERQRELQKRCWGLGRWAVQTAQWSWPHWALWFSERLTGVGQAVVIGGFSIQSEI